MNKTKKLLSVLLAVIMALSCMTVMASAAKTSYGTVDELTALNAYSPYGQVTRLSAEARTSIVLDYLDSILVKANINPGKLFDMLGLSLTVDLRSVNAICGTIDSLYKLRTNTLVSLISGLLGIVADLNVNSWETGMTRENRDQLYIIDKLLTLLADNKQIVYDVISTGKVDLGLASSALSGLDLSIIADIPGLIKGLVFPLLERWDDSVALIKDYDTKVKGNGNVETVVNARVKKLFTDDMSITTVKYDAAGNMTSEHTKMPFTTIAPTLGTVAADTDSRYVYVMSAAIPVPGTTLTLYHIVDNAEAKALATTPDEVNGSPAAYTYFKEAQTYVMSQEVEGSDTYVWKATDKQGNTWSLKWYNDNSPLLPGFDGSMFDLTTMSAGDLLYKFIPVVFEQMAPVVLNGSMKKILGGLFGAQYNYVGQVGEDAVLALPDASDTFFTQEQGEYLWEWSDYKVINGNHYYRFQDQIYAADLSQTNNYFDIINWDYKITGDFMNEFIPASASDAGVRILQNVNNFLVKVAETVLLPSAETDNWNTDYTATWTRPTFTAGNANLVANIKALAQAFIKLAPQHIFGSDYATNPRCYYNLMISDDNDTVLVGIAAQLVDLIMPQMSLPSADNILASGAKVGAIIAAVVRELAAQLAPEYNFDALIYTDYGTTTSDNVKSFVTGKDSSYWLDVCLTIGMNVGFEYIRAFADLGEDSEEWTSFVAYSGYGVDGKTYAAGTDAAALRAEWEGMLDYIVDWALTTDKEWAWKMANLVSTSGYTVSLGTAEDPWVKLDTIFFSLLPIDEILTISTNSEYPTKLEKFLRYDLILGLVDLRWDALIDTIQLNGTNQYFRTANVLDEAAKLLKGVVNGLFAKLGGGSYALIPAAVTDFDTLANQGNIATLAKDLIGVLKTAMITNGGLATILPFVNFFIGWKTDPQVIADPQIWSSFRDGNDYAFQWTGNGVYPAMDADNTKLMILNSSSGMLETHRGSSVTDHAYDIQIKSITSDATVNTITFDYGDGLISPYETLPVKIGGTYNGEEAVTATITYEYIGKDGKGVGGTLYTSYTFFVSDLYEDANIEGREAGDESDGKYGIDPFKAYQFTEDVYTSITTFEPSVWGTNSATGGTSNYKYTNAPDPVTRDCNDNITDSSKAINKSGYGDQYFEYFQNRDGGWASSFAKDGSTSGKLYYAKDGVTAETELPYGVYDMGQVGIKYSDDTKVWKIDFIYYNDYDIYDVYTANLFNAYTADQVADISVYNEYNDAWKDIVKLATYPMMTKSAETDGASTNSAAHDYVDVIMPQIPAALERFDAAKKAFEEAKAAAEASGSAAALPEYVQGLEAQLALDDGDGEVEINFQDYEFYEYFNYADLRTEARNLVKTYYAPDVMDDYYIVGSGIREAELNAVIAAETNTNIQKGIEATKTANDPDAVASSQLAHDEWQMPYHTKLYIDDMTSRLAYYKQFVNDSVKEDADMVYFLNQEIAHVEAQSLNEADYTAASWADYAEALAAAKTAVASETLNSKLFQAKWDLMVAYKNLLKLTDSLIEAGGTADLAKLKAQADAIFAMNYEDITLTEEAAAKMTKDEALGHLIRAIGYYYVGEDGNTWNLYDNSALEYLDNDRPNRTSNQAKVNACANNLTAALAYFATESALPELGVVDGSTGAFGDVATDGAGLTTGYIYGITVGGSIEDSFALVDPSVGYTKKVASTLTGASENGTGAKVQVYNNSDVLVAEYTLIVFGDVNGDGGVTGVDQMQFAQYTGGATSVLTGDALIAADVNADGTTTGVDQMSVGQYTSGTTSAISQTVGIKNA